MGIFSKLKKVFNPGGAILSKAIGDGHDYQGVGDYLYNGKKNAEKDQLLAETARQARSGGESGAKPVFSPDPGLNPNPVRLGWTNNGRFYANSPFNGVQPNYGSMSFGSPAGGVNPQATLQNTVGGMVGTLKGAKLLGTNGNSGGFAARFGNNNPNSGAGVYGRMLQSMPYSGMVGNAGAQPSGPPTTQQAAASPQAMQAAILRGGYR